MNHHERHVIPRAYSRTKVEWDQGLHPVDDAEICFEDAFAIAHAEDLRHEPRAKRGPPVCPDVSRMPPADLHERVLPGEQPPDPKCPRIPQVDTSECAHFGHHPHLPTLRPDGLRMTLTVKSREVT